eukprot:bmy_12103T0
MADAPVAVPDLALLLPREAFQPGSETPRIWFPPYPHPTCVTWTQLAEGPMRQEGNKKLKNREHFASVRERAKIQRETLEINTGGIMARCCIARVKRASSWLCSMIKHARHLWSKITNVKINSTNVSVNKYTETVNMKQPLRMLSSRKGCVDIDSSFGNGFAVILWRARELQSQTPNYPLGVQEK